MNFPSSGRIGCPARPFVTQASVWLIVVSHSQHGWLMMHDPLLPTGATAAVFATAAQAISCPLARFGTADPTEIDARAIDWHR